MSLITQFTQSQLETFKTFDDRISESAILNFSAAAAEYLRLELEKNGEEAELKMPHGTYRAAVRKSGEKGNINVSLELSKQFSKALNDDEMLEVDMIPKEFIKMYIGYVGGEMGNSNLTPIELACDSEAVHFLKNISANLVDIGKTFAKEDKEFTVDFPNHGKFIYEYDNDKIVCRFEADKVFKQALKDDEKLEA